MSHSSKQWRQPAPDQLKCEQELANALKALVLTGKHTGNLIDYSAVNREHMAEHIELWLKQAQKLGNGYAQRQLEQLERGLGGSIMGGLKAIGESARNLIDRVVSWATDLFTERVEALGEGATADEVETVLEGVAEQVAETLATTEIQAVIEQTVMDVLLNSGVAMIEAVNEPDACPVCVENADAGPIPIGTSFPSGDTNAPFHHCCRCHVVAVSQ